MNLKRSLTLVILFMNLSNSTLLSKILETVSKIDNIIEDLAIMNEISNNHVKIIQNITRKFRDETKPINEHILASMDLRRLIDKLINSSAIADQILIQGNALSQRFPSELNNISFDFTNFKNFKYPVLTDACNSISFLKTHGFSKETENIGKLLQIRCRQYDLYMNAELLTSQYYDLLAKANKPEKTELTMENLIELQKELSEIKANNKLLNGENEKLKRECAREHEINVNLSESLENTRDDLENIKRFHKIEIEKKNKEIYGLRNAASQSIFMAQEIQSLKAQLNAALIRNEKLQLRCDALELQNDRLISS